jgi:hypothetical protein
VKTGIRDGLKFAPPEFHPREIPQALSKPVFFVILNEVQALVF